MLENKHNLTVDTQSKSIGNAFVEVVQNDNVALEVQIYNNNLLVNNTAYTYTLLSVLPSKERIIRQGLIGPNGYPVFKLGVEEMSETGIILAMVQVFDELGNRVTSYDFKYRMKEDMSTGGVVPSADNPKFVIITEDSLNQTVQDAQLSRQELDAMKTDTDGVAHLTPNDRLVSDYNKINVELGTKADATSVYTKTETDTLLGGKTNTTDFNVFKKSTETQLTEIKQDGIVLKNDLTNGGFGDGILGWVGVNSTLSVVDNALLVTATGGNATSRVYSDAENSIENQKKFYFSAQVKVTNPDATYISAYLADTTGVALGGSNVLLSSPIQDVSYFLSGEGTSNSDMLGKLRVYINHSYATKEVALGKEMKVDNVLIIDLSTVFGFGNEPTKEEMDMLISILGGWFDGEITVTQKQYVTWLLNLMRQNRNAILALGGTIV